MLTKSVTPACSHIPVAKLAVCENVHEVRQIPVRFADDTQILICVGVQQLPRLAIAKNKRPTPDRNSTTLSQDFRAYDSLNLGENPLNPKRVQTLAPAPLGKGCGSLM